MPSSHRPTGHSLPPSLTPERIRGLSAVLATVLIGVLLLYLSVFGTLVFVLVGALYALLLWRGMPLLADFDTTKRYLRGLSGAGTTSPPTFPPAQHPSAQRPSAQRPSAQYPPHMQARQPFPVQQTPLAPAQPAPMRAAEPETTVLFTGRSAYTEAIAEDPATSAAVLNAIAGSRPDLHPALARNPATYADLLSWLSELADPAVEAELAKRSDRR